MKARFQLLIKGAGVCLLSLFLIQNQNYGQSTYGQISGWVLEQKKGAPIPAANVVVSGTVFGAASNDRGYFVISHLDPGTYRVICSAIGFKKQTKVIQVDAGQITEVTFRLQQTVIPMNQFVVTASKYRQDVNEIPVTIDIITTHDLVKRNAVTIDQVLKHVPGVQAVGNNISIRGSSGFTWGVGSRILVLLDGMPFLTGDTGSITLDALPTAQIQQVEVMKGAGSALYGSNAMGGVVNIITRTPSSGKSSLRVRSYTGFYDQPSYPQWRWSSRRRHFEGLTVDCLTNFLNVSSIISFNLKSNMSFKENADFRKWNVAGIFRFSLTPNNYWNVISGYLKSDDGSFIFWRDCNHALRVGNEPEDIFTRTYTTYFYLYPVMTQILSSRFFYRLRLRFTRAHSEDHAHARPGYHPQLLGIYRQSTADTYGGELQFNYQYSPETNIVFGFDGHKNDVSSIQYGYHRLGRFSVYFQNEKELFHGFKLTTGFRWDWEWGSDIATMSQFNPKVGVNYLFANGNSFRCSVGRGFRAPSAAERFISTFANMIKVLPNPALKPERNISAEIGCELGVTSHSRLDISVFSTDYWGLIEPQLNAQKLEVQFANITRARIQGLELNQRITWWENRLESNLGYTYVYSKNLSRLPNGEPSQEYGKMLKHRPRHLLYVTTSAKWNNWLGVVDFRHISKIERTDEVTNIPDINKRVPIYVTDLSLGWQKSKYSVWFLVKNLFQYYYVESPGNLGELRNYTLKLDWHL